MPELSIIIPVYNVADYVAATVKSLFEQHNPAVEYIFVNDGSPDNSWQVLQDTLLQYPECKKNSKLIDLPENGGVENARICGLQQAEGEYIWFVDSDDLIAEGAINAILTVLQKNPVDYLAIGFQMLPPGESINEVSAAAVRKVSGEELFSSIISFQGNHAAWKNIIKRELTNLHAMQKTGLRIAEDYVMHCHWSIYAESAAVLENPLYGYVIRPQSAMNTSKLTNIMQSTRNAMQILANMADSLPGNKQQLFKTGLRTAAVRKRMEYFAEFFKLDSPPEIPELLDKQVQVQVSLRKDWQPTAWGLKPVLLCDKLKCYRTMQCYLQILKKAGL